MIKIITTLLLVTSFACADTYYAKAEPIERYVLKANISGLVVKADEFIEGKIATQESVLEIDCATDERELKLTREKIKLQKEVLKLNQSVYKRKASYYKAIKNLSTKSKTARDNAYYDQAGAKEKVNTLITQLEDLQQREFVLSKSIKDKKVIKPGWYIYKLLVKKNDFVNMGTPMVEIANTSKAKLTLFLSFTDAANADAMQLYINDVKSDAKIEKVWQMSDSEHISSYQAQLTIDAPLRFSKLVKVELKRSEP